MSEREAFLSRWDKEFQTTLKVLKAYPSAKISQVDQVGTGKTAVFHFTMTGARVPEVKFSAAGKAIKK